MFNPKEYVRTGTSKAKRPFFPLEVLEPRTLRSTTPVYYSIDGSGNNLSHSTWGEAGALMSRIGPADFSDGISTPSGADRPSARLITNTVSAQPDDILSSRHVTDWIYAWGQFIDHDLDHTLEGTTEADNIAVPTGDPSFDPNNTGTQTITNFRDNYAHGSGTSKTNPRQFTNIDTPYLDGSVVYGSDATTAAALRTFHGGRLKTSAGDLLPLNTASLNIENDTQQFPNTQLMLGGDARANENTELTSVDVLFVREHNYWADKFAKQHPKWSDEQIYQSARQIVIAEIQSITYNEYLPALMGDNAMSDYTGYQPNVKTSVSLEFADAAFRVGHTQLNSSVDFFANDGSESHDQVAFRDAFFNPTVLEEGTESSILKYLAADTSEEVDEKVEDDFRNFLFGQPGQGGLDLAAIDIERGRDLGLPDYNSERAALGLPKVTTFSQITSDKTLQKQLKSLYGNVNNIDLMVGGLAENHVTGSSLGPTFQAIVTDQFTRLRAGDRLFYQNNFTGSELTNIQNTTLASVIERNNSDITNLQDDVFLFQTGTIAGKVFLDSNRNGKQDNAEQGSAGVSLELFSSKGNFVDEQTTAADGSYAFQTGKQNAGYYVVAQRPSDSTGFTTPSLLQVDLVDNTGAGEFTEDFGLNPAS